MDSENINITDGKTGTEEADKAVSLEDMFERIEEIVNALEDKDIKIEDAIVRYEEGMKLIAECNSRIDGIEEKVLVLGSDGSTDEF